MINQVKITVSLVVYKNPVDQINQCINSVLNSHQKIQIIVVDNSPEPMLESCDFPSNVIYLYTENTNLGFSKGHNLTRWLIEESDYHLIINPDIYVPKETVPTLVEFMEKNAYIGLVQPKILFFDSDQVQYLCKRYPTFFALFGRRFLGILYKKLFRKYSDWYEMKDTGYNSIFECIYLSGCFMLFRRSILDKLEWFDPNIFMYIEDADITLRASKISQTVFYPYVYVKHGWQRDNHKSLKLTLVAIKSAFYFFKKHGFKLK